jgi:hypothetical protein
MTPHRWWLDGQRVMARWVIAYSAEQDPDQYQYCGRHPCRDPTTRTALVEMDDLGRRFVGVCEDERVCPHSQAVAQTIL